ncbi:MAG: roadblock/LC7 domain-containing protein [Chloroflexota bacterium]
MAKSKYSIGGEYWHMLNLYRQSSEIEDCFLSTIDGKPIVRRFGLKRQSLSEKLVFCLQELQKNCPEIQACNLVSVDGLGIASIIPSTDGDLIEAQEAVMMSLGNQIAQAFGNNSAEYVHVTGKSADTLLIPIEETILMILLKGTTISRATQLSIQQVVEQLTELLND